jgi:hypothetical protein
MSRISLDAKVWVATFFIAIAGDVLAGAIRYYTSMIGVAQAAYLPKILMLGWVIYILVKEPKALYGLLGLYVLAETFVSLSNGVQSESVLFWLWTLVPLFFAMTAPAQSLSLLKTRPMLLVFAGMTALTCIGIAMSGLMTLPWVGETVSVGGHSIRMATASYVGVASRLSGFGRDSATVALMAGLLTTWVYMQTPSKWLSLLVLAGAGAAVYATTNKTAPVSIAVIVIARLLFSARGFRRASITAAALVIFLPMASFLVSAAINLPARGFVTLSSFQDRMINTWPLLIDALWKGGYIWFGLGPGGFGSAATYYESPFSFNVSYADNIFLYGMASLGLIGASLLVMFMVRLMLRTQSQDKAVWAVLLYMLFAAGSTDIFESIGCLLFFGLAVNYLRHAVPVPQQVMRPFAHRYGRASW